MSARSLRMRFLLGGAATIFAALAISWLALAFLFERHIERRAVAELTRDAQQLVAGLTLDERDTPRTGTVPADSRFSQPASGLYWQLSTTQSSLRSGSLFDQPLPPPTTTTGDAWETRTARGPFNQRLLLLERTVRPEQDGTPVLVQVAQDRAAIRAARNEFARELARYLALLWLVLSIAAGLQVHLGLRPFRRVREELAALKESPSARLTADHPSEIKPLAASINALADAREADLDAASRRASDLAHGLKTPLAALSAESRRAREAGAGEAADGLDRAIAAARVAVEAELARSRVAKIRATARRGASAPARLAAESVIGVVERTDFGADRVFEVEIPDTLVVPMAPEDLAELLGALVENAARFARRRVRVSGREEGASPRDAGTTAHHTTRILAIEDDGPGLSTGRAEDVLARGGRLDETGPGHGLGLSIARELAEATGGSLTLHPSVLGGLCVTVQWSPAATEQAA